MVIALMRVHVYKGEGMYSEEQHTRQESASDFRKVVEGFTHIRHNSKYLCLNHYWRHLPHLHHHKLKPQSVHYSDYMRLQSSENYRQNLCILS